MASLSPTTVPWTWQAVNIYLWTWQWYRSSACNHSSTLGTPGVILDYYAYPICHLCLSVFPNKIQFPAFFILQHFMSGLIQVTSNFFPVQFFFTCSSRSAKLFLSDLLPSFYFINIAELFYIQYFIQDAGGGRKSAWRILGFCLLRNSRSFKRIRQMCKELHYHCVKSFFESMVHSNNSVGRN